MGSPIFAIVYTAIQFIVFLFVVIATPLPMFRSKVAPFGIHTCQTLWGTPTKCNGSKYSARGTTAFVCGRRRNNMNGGAAFAIISIVTTLIALILGLLLALKVMSALGVIIMTILCIITILISWACVAGVMTEKMCGYTILGVKYPGTKYSGTYNYGAGFGLMLTAWCLEVLNLVIAILCLVCGGSRRRRSSSKSPANSPHHDDEEAKQ